MSTTTNADLWLDHREAIIVVLTEAGEETKCIESNVEKQLRRSGEPTDGPFEEQEVPADDSRQREYSRHLARYYDEIISCLRDAKSILILGPGEAKGELQKRFEHYPSAACRIALEAADKMTGPQVVARVRHPFSRDPARLL